MALKYAGVQVEHREIVLRNKPQSLLQVSPKGTVPVLCVDDLILDQSLDIMLWALQLSDPDGWAIVDQSIAKAWIEKNDGPFKALLDQYKYPNRYPDINQAEVFHTAIELMLKPIEVALQANPYLMGGKLSWVDVAIFPFIRQFSMVNPEMFAHLPLPLTQRWLSQHLESELFHSVMHQNPSWVD
ncbi:glutathione S-transferase [Polynucleobacter antarcticus]